MLKTDEYPRAWHLGTTLAGRLLIDAALIALFGLSALRCGAAFLQAGSFVSLELLLGNALFLGLALTRREATLLDSRPISWLLAIAGTITPLLLAPAPIGGALPRLGLAIENLGAACIILAMLALHRSFGIVAAHRGLRTGGLYRLIRHPLYSAELLFYLGFVVANPSWLNLALWALEFTLQWQRALAEERLLAQDPDYQAYQTRVPYRLVPGLF